MINVELARQLKQLGLPWRPSEHDCFVIPESNLDGQIFVVSQFPALVQAVRGLPTITFHGSSEWALDYILLNDVVWMPSETQLREAIAALIGPDAPLRLDRIRLGYRCEIACGDRMLEFDAAVAEDAYAQALLAVLEARQ